MMENGGMESGRARIIYINLERWNNFDGPMHSDGAVLFGGKLPDRVPPFLSPLR